VRSRLFTLVALVIVWRTVHTLNRSFGSGLMGVFVSLEPRVVARLPNVTRVSHILLLSSFHGYLASVGVGADLTVPCGEYMSLS
jgi:hypothetical protein